MKDRQPWPWAPSLAGWLSVHSKCYWQKHKEKFLEIRVWLGTLTWFFSCVCHYFKLFQNKATFLQAGGDFPYFPSSIVYPVFFKSFGVISEYSAIMRLWHNWIQFYHPREQILIFNADASPRHCVSFFWGGNKLLLRVAKRPKTFYEFALTFSPMGCLVHQHHLRSYVGHLKKWESAPSKME